MVMESKFSDNDDKSENIVSIYNLPPIYDESDVKSLFANIGTVVECSIEHDTSKSSSRAIAKFSSEKEAEDAAVLSGVSVRYHILKITKGKPTVIAKNDDNKDSKSEGSRDKIAHSTESTDETITRMSSKVLEDEISLNEKSIPPESEKISEIKGTIITKRDDNGRSDYRSRDRIKRRTRRIRSSSSSESYRRRDRYRNRRDYTSRSYSRYRPRRGSKYGRSRREYKRDYSTSTSRSSTSSSRSYYSRGTRSRNYSDDIDRHHSRGRKGYRRRRSRSRSRKVYGSRHRYER